MMNHTNIIDSSDNHVIYKDSRNAFAHFNSVDAYIDYNMKHENTSNSMKKSTDWTYNASGQELIDMLERRDMVASIMDKLDTRLELPNVEALQCQDTTEQNTIVMQDHGFMFDSVAYYAGEDECMINIDVETVESKTIWLATNTISQGDVGADRMVNRGVALIRAIKTLQSSGWSVGLVSYFSGISDYNIMSDVVVKRPDEALNETLVAGAVAHPSFFRTLGHNVSAVLNENKSGGMGMRKAKITDFGTSFADATKLVLLDVCFSYSDCRTPEDAEQWVSDQLNKALAER